MQDAIEPDLALAAVLSQWNRLAAALAENHRHRATQMRHLTLNSEVNL